MITKRNILQHFVAACAVLVLPLAHAQPAKSAAAQTPDALVLDLSKDVLASVKTDKSLQSGDISQLQKLVDEKILPYVNFEKMTRLAVGRGWRQATPEQREQLTKEFRTLLVRTYAGALASAREHEVKLQPFRPQSEKDVVVRTQVVAPRGEPIQLDYRLEKTDVGWKIYDVNVLGVWLVENYRNSFAGEINQHGVDGLIKSLVERNRQPASTEKKAAS
ncbi:MAG TPA: ABC transporter substrate-binding protein [Burkholderiaceae bacterium]|nr:ABC transporter substrate-binding protein [Burkholderiaceae bacterium]